MNSYPKEYFYKKILAAKLYIEKHYAENIDVKNIANEAHFSKFDFIRQFKNTYGRTPYNYLKQVRLNKASEILKSSKIAVKEVCFSVGYDSLSSFSGLFKKEFGLPPQQFQNKHRQRAESIRKKPLNHIPGCFAENKGWKMSNFEEVE